VNKAITALTSSLWLVEEFFDALCVRESKENRIGKRSPRQIFIGRGRHVKFITGEYLLHGHTLFDNLALTVTPPIMVLTEDQCPPDLEKPEAN